MSLGAGMTKAQYMFAIMIIFACAALPPQPHQLVHAKHRTFGACVVRPQLRTARSL